VVKEHSVYNSCQSNCCTLELSINQQSIKVLDSRQISC